MNDMLLRQNALDHFHRLRRRAALMQTWNRLRRRPRTLLPLAPIRARLPHAQALPQGIQMVPVRQIVGSAQRAHEYDRQFRPLNDGLRDRWVGVSVLSQTTGWKPVELVRIGNLYFVVDGHHRLSVARQNGISTIEAMVTAYPLPLEFDVNDSLADVLARLRVQGNASDEWRVAGGRVQAACGVTCSL